jgi:hypothetical protein
MLRAVLNCFAVALALVSRPPVADSTASVRLAAGQAVLIDPVSRSGGCCLEILEGIARVFCPCEETQGMTLAFLQPGDLLRTDRLCSDGVCVEALTPLAFHSHPELSGDEQFDVVNEWVLQLLRLRHLGSAEQRLQALLALLVIRLGRRCGDWCDLPFRLTHDRIGELIGTTRVTTTRLMSRLRASQLLVSTSAEPTVRLAPELLANAPLAA